MDEFSDGTKIFAPKNNPGEIKREWVGLTDEERKAFSYFVNWEMLDQIEAKLKEKNT
jgi:hypothetical protein